MIVFKSRNYGMDNVQKIEEKKSLDITTGKSRYFVSLH